MLVSSIPITRKGSLQAHSCEIQNEDLNISSVSASIKMASKKQHQETFCFPTAAPGFSVSPGLHLQAAGQASYHAQLQGFLHKLLTQPPLALHTSLSMAHTSNGFLFLFSHRQPKMIWVWYMLWSHDIEFLFSLRSGPWGGSLQWHKCCGEFVP